MSPEPPDGERNSPALRDQGKDYGSHHRKALPSIDPVSVFHIQFVARNAVRHAQDQRVDCVHCTSDMAVIVSDQSFL